MIYNAIFDIPLSKKMSTAVFLEVLFHLNLSLCHTSPISLYNSVANSWGHCGNVLQKCPSISIQEL